MYSIIIYPFPCLCSQINTKSRYVIVRCSRCICDILASMNIYLDLFLTFARIGGLTFGGGIAMLPILEREVVDRKNWASEEELTDYYAIGQCTPGIIAVNTATFIGQKVAGTFGGIIATLGLVFPSIVIITVIAAVLRNFAELQVVKNAFAGIRVCVCALVLNAAIKLAKKAIVDIKTLIIFIAVFAGMLIFDVSPVVFVVAAAAAGLIIKGLEEGREK